MLISVIRLTLKHSSILFSELPTYIRLHWSREKEKLNSTVKDQRNLNSEDEMGHEE